LYTANCHSEGLFPILFIFLGSGQKTDSDIWGLQTVAERVVDRVDEALKADIMHWAAIYVMKHSSG